MAEHESSSDRWASLERELREQAERRSRGVVAYPVTLTIDDSGTVLVTFPDVPEAMTHGETDEEAMANAADALLIVFDSYMAMGLDWPAPSWIEGSRVVEIPLSRFDPGEGG